MARNTNRQGANFELDVMHYLDGCSCEGRLNSPKHIGWRGFGYDSLRSSGSRGAIDVVSVGPSRPGFVINVSGPLFIQCKRNIKAASLSPADRRRVQNMASRAGAVPLVAYHAMDETTGRVRPHFRLLTGLGPADWVPWEPGEDD